MINYCLFDWFSFIFIFPKVAYLIWFALIFMNFKYCAYRSQHFIWRFRLHSHRFSQQLLDTCYYSVNFVYNQIQGLLFETQSRKSNFDKISDYSTIFHFTRGVLNKVCHFVKDLDYENSSLFWGLSKWFWNTISWIIVFFLYSINRPPGNFFFQVKLESSSHIIWAYYFKG